MGHSPWGCKESDTTERLHFHALNIKILKCESNIEGIEGISRQLYNNRKLPYPIFNNGWNNYIEDQ